MTGETRPRPGLSCLNDEPPPAFGGPNDIMAPLPGLWGAMAGVAPLDPPVKPNQT